MSESEVDAVVGGMSQAVVTLVKAAMEIAEVIARQRAEAARAVREENDRAARLFAERVRDQRQAINPVIRQVWDDSWWQRASPETIAGVWQVTDGWARHGDPSAMVALQHMRDEIHDRYGVDLPETPADRTNLLELLGAPSAGEQITVNQDRDDDLVLIGDRAEQLVEDSRHRDSRILTGEIDASPEEARAAILAERRRLADFIVENDPRYAGARADPAALHAQGKVSRDDLDQAQQRAADLSGQDPQVIIDAREKLNQLSLRLQGLDAEERGEDPGQVHQAAALKLDLDRDWWQTANSEEIAATVKHVHAWSHGESKDSMLSSLQDGVRAHYDIAIDPDAGQTDLESRLFRAQAEQRGDQVLNYRIEAPHLTENQQVEYRDVESGRIAVPADEQARDTARRIMADHTGDMRRAADGRLRVVLTDPSGNHVTALDAGRITDLRDADRLRGLGLDDDAEAARAEEYGDQSNAADDPGHADASYERADQLRAAAEQDRDAAAALEGVADVEAVEAVSVAGEGWPTNPSQRFTSSAPQRRPRNNNPRTPKRQQPELNR